MMTVGVIYGGTRGDGNTEYLTERVIQGLTVDRIYLRNYTISPIEDLRHTSLGFQDIEDDYGAIIDRMMKHNTLLFATPIYWYSMSGHMKNFIDRWSQTLRDTKRPSFREEMATKTAYVLAIGGDEPLLKGLPLVQQFQYIFGFFGIHFEGYILGKGNRPGDVAEDQEALFKADQMRDRLQQIGE